ncbi:MAG: nickel pincer cofactor biosynthesis protein LarC [Verrucomicrobiota bacterium]|nr:nickel pincer cofactor biosynthesis protein LarC [Limisphaera sp.]MDW8382419.1 nickel pincer cofactor biosynthesis protein LarC [Verrucomicrobiota bacterium]
MNSILYLDIFSGISGDMLLGALFDLGVDPALVETELRQLPLGPWHWHIHRTTLGNIAGCRVEIRPGASNTHPAPLHGLHSPHTYAPHDHEHRSFLDIKNLIEQSPLDAWVRQKALALFQRIAEAEARIHSQPMERVHFHEIGAIDSLVDILGGCIALQILGRPRVLAGPVIDGSGWIECAHGRFPVPAPATLSILGARGIPISQCDEPCELVTPTGAAFLAEFVDQFGPMQNLIPQRIGYGLGHRTLRSRPNVLRAILGPASPPTADWDCDTVAVLETNLDDVTGETLGQFFETVLQAGALDAFCAPVQMKKSRPGVLLTVLCLTQDADRLTELILQETTALGVRRTFAERRKLSRQFLQVETPYGAVQVKIARLHGRIVSLKPEWDDCHQRALQHGVSPRVVWQSALTAATTAAHLGQIQ